ncbi:MAG: hypothetical protein AAFU71_12775 [Cyanobacteria bacterium J06632_22]
MNVEQTTQLIALIFNSALMVLLSGLLWMAAWYRQQSLLNQLQQVQQSQQILWVNAKPNREPQLQRLQQQQRRLHRQFRLAYSSMMISHYALAMLLLSVLMLGLRTLLFVDGLISLALLMFVLGAAGLLLGVLLLLVDVHQTPVMGQAVLTWASQSVVQWVRHLRQPQPVPVESMYTAYKTPRP